MEKTSPAITARVVITSCISSLLQNCLVRILLRRDIGLAAQRVSLSASSSDLGERLSERGAVGGLAAEELGCFVITLGANVDGVARANHFEELLDVPITEADAAVRSSLTDGTRDVGSVNAVASTIETDPAGTKVRSYEKRSPSQLPVPRRPVPAAFPTGRQPRPGPRPKATRPRPRRPR